MESLPDAIRHAAISLGVSLVLAAVIIGWSLPETPDAPKYSAFVVGDKIVRLQTNRGFLVACDLNRCVRMLGNGKNIQPNSAPGLAAGAGAVPPPTRGALPAPQPKQPN